MYTITAKRRLSSYWCSIIFLFVAHSIKAQDNFTTSLQDGHKLEVSALAVSPDGNVLASGSKDHSIILWNRKNGKIIRHLNHHTGNIFSLEFSKDGKHILTSSSDQRTCITNIATGEVVMEVKNTKDRLNGSCFGSESLILIMNNRDGLEVWDTETQSLIKRVEKTFENYVISGFVNEAARTVISAGDYKQISLVPLHGGEPISIDFTKPSSYSYSPDGKYVAVGSSKIIAGLFGAQSGDSLITFRHDDYKCDGCNTLVAFNSKSNRWFTGAKGTPIKMWDLKGNLKQTFSTMDVRPRYMGTLNNDSYLYVAGGDEIWVFDIKSAKQVYHVKHPSLSYFKPCFSESGTSIFVPGDFNDIKEVSLSNHEMIKQFKGYHNKKRDDGINLSYNTYWDEGTLDRINSKPGMVVSPNGKTVALGKLDSTIVILDLHTGRRIKSLHGHSKSVFALAFSPDGRYLASAGGDRKILLWNTSDWTLLKTLKGHVELVFDLKFNGDGTRLISSGWDAYNILWDVQKGESIEYLRLGDHSGFTPTFTPDDNYVLIGDIIGVFGLYEIETLEKVRTYIGHSGLINSIETRNDRMLTTGLDGRTNVYNYKNGYIDGKFRGHHGRVLTGIFLTDNTCITGGADRSLYVWDIESGVASDTLVGHNAAINYLWLSKDKSRLISGAVDGEIRVWDLKTKETLFSYMSIDQFNWLALHPSGVFDGSPEALKMVNYVSGTEVLPVESLFNKLYIPSLIDRIRKGESFNDHSSNIQSDLEQTDGIQIAVQLNGKARAMRTDSLIRVPDSSINLLIRSDEKFSNYRVYNNNKLIHDTEIENNITFRGSTEKSIKVSCQAGENTYRAVGVRENGTESIPDEVKVIYDGRASKTDLFILSVGINKYKNSSYNLNYAYNDAKTVTKQISTSAQPIFDEIYEYVITDKDATRENIIRAFKEISEKAGPEDVFIFFYAGHGVMNELGEKSEFFLVTHDVTNLYDDFDVLNTKAVSATLLKQQSVYVRAAKQVYILDACQSGGALMAFATRGAEKDKALAQLARSTGTYFLTAAQEFEYANEVGNLGHGVFTYALLEILAGKHALASADEKITIAEIKSYIEERVPELSQQYKGTPQYPISFGFGQDFPISIVSKSE